MVSTNLLSWVFILGAASADAPPDFDSQIVPLLTKSGCNVAACHGAAAGRGGFHLSLWGLDPEADYQTIVRQHEGRRVNQAEAEHSLLLLKGTWQTDHGGEDALSRSPDGEERILRWIRAGAPRGNGRQLVELQVSPAGTTLLKVGQHTSVKAMAIFDDGYREDVTRWTVFQPNDPTAVILDGKANTARVTRGGRHVVLARYMSQVIPLVFVSPLTDARPAFSDQHANKIDQYVFAALREMGLPASPVANDREFVRRLFLDLTGTLPTITQLTTFATDDSPSKRESLVDQLLSSDEFVDLWTYRVGKLLRIRSTAQDTTGAATFHHWLHEQVKSGTPYDQLVRSLITAEGDTHEVGPANFYRVVAGARNQAEYVSELLMGARMRCANCHNHPLDRWTQDDYHGLAALFAKVEQGRVVRIGTRGAVSHPRTGQPARPRIPGERFVDGVADPRQLLANWITDDQNPYFATAIVNRLWRFVMGRGLIEPTDDVRPTNPPSHPELLEFLAQDFAAHDYDIRHSLRLIVTSAAYARSSQSVGANASDTMFYSHAATRPLESEVLADAITRVTGVTPRYGDRPQGTSAVSLFDPQVPSPSLDILGRCSREQSCESAAQAITLEQSLHMINGPLLNDRILAKQGRLREMLSAGNSNEQIVHAFYLHALSRRASPNELEYWNKQLVETEGSTRDELLEDFVWSLLVCREFVTNH